MSSFETVLYEKENGLAFITLNRPQALNVYNVQMRDDLYQVLGAVKDDPEVRAVILKGAGGKAFCAGADLSEFLTAPSRIIARQARWERDVWGLFLSLPQPLIAALHGFVLGSGIEMALYCDIRLASEEARFGLPEAGLGIIPAAGATQTLPRLIGRAPGPELLPSAVGLAREIMGHDAMVVKNIKEAVNRGLDLSLKEGLELEARLAAGVQ
jgi:enoyl-CoA hydratase/carnithine racemase